VELLILNPYCSLASMLLVHMCLYNLEYISFSDIVEKGVKREIGLCTNESSLKVGGRLA